MNTIIIRIIVFMLVASTIISAVGCGGGDDQTPSPKSTPTTTQKPQPVTSDIQMVSIPGGTFQMGDHSGSGYSDERPVHSVTLSPFRISAYEVTYAQWIEVRNWAEAHGYTFNMPGDMGSEDCGGTQDINHPVTDIEWYDAVLWCNALSEMEGRTPCYYTSAARSTVYRSGRPDIQNDWGNWTANGYRLPTEAEWEYACRAGTTTEYSFWNSIAGSDANYYYSGDSYDDGTTPGGNYAANSWGLYDMHGNVWEWCWDYYGSSYYSDSPSSNPKGPLTGSHHVVRGGSWNNGTEHLRSANRNYINTDLDNYNIGFRPVLSQ
jgi:sulfatase modifying factor 1